MKLYFTPGSCSWACWIALEWAQADYTVEQVDTRSEAYKRINPLGVVPALDIGTGRIMTQTEAILRYVAERYPERELGSNTGLENQFIFNETLSFLTGDFHPAFWPYFVPERFTTDTTSAAIEAARAAAYPRIERVLGHLDGLLAANGGHVYGHKRSVADAYAFVMARWSENLPTSWRDYPHVSAFMQRMLQDAAVVKVMAQPRA